MNTIDKWIAKLKVIRDRVDAQEIVLLQVAFDDWHHSLDESARKTIKSEPEVLFIRCIEAISANAAWLETPLFTDFFVYYVQSDYALSRSDAEHLFSVLKDVWNQIGGAATESVVRDNKDFLTYLCVCALRNNKPEALERKIGLGLGIVRKLYDLISFKTSADYVAELDRTLAEVFAELSHTIGDRPWEIDCLQVRYLLKDADGKIFEDVFLNSTPEFVKVLVEFCVLKEFEEKDVTRILASSFRNVRTDDFIRFLDEQGFIYAVCSLQSRKMKWAVNENVQQATAIAHFWLFCHAEIYAGEFDLKRLFSWNAFYQESFMDLAPAEVVRTVVHAHSEKLSPQAIEKAMYRLMEDPEEVEQALDLGRKILSANQEQSALRAVVIRSLAQYASKGMCDAKPVLEIFDDVLKKDGSKKVRDAVVEGLVRIG